MVIGITGGIGSGKTTVSNMLRKQGYKVIDSDLYAKYVTNNDETVIREIKEEFGEDLYCDGKLDRKQLGRIVFDDKNKLELLNSIVHPRVLKHLVSAIGDSPDILFIESALMIESGSYKLMDEIILVTAPEDVRIKRVMERNLLSKEEVTKRIDSQLDDVDRIGYCKYMISTRKSLNEVKTDLNRTIFRIKTT